ncbi:MAG: glycosyltransferase family 2 protein [Microcella sp.]|uniref:glycosyltransferase family A protein n=1 Tax=Microcella sp. TaxID=1913979 RepID=UPI0024C5B93C|nr:glycosyltransferase family 2 protein [Microcella sp.]UYN82950.1 MAG: glycosyltransferase family 2 protein [Microcella sp.]
MHRTLPTDRISVVIPVRNDRQYLERCLDALALQTYPAFEVIVVDNASDDASGVLASYRGARVVREPVVGIPAASATGYDSAQGDIIARLDSDSVPGVTWLASVCEAFQRHPNAAAVTGSGVAMDDDGTPRRRASSFYMRAYFFFVGLALGHPPLWGSALAMRRAVWLEVRDEFCRNDQRVHDDMDLSIHLGPGHEIVFDHRLTLPVSSRPLSLDGSALVRFARGFYTILRHWPREFPLARFVRRAQARRELEAQPA